MDNPLIILGAGVAGIILGFIFSRMFGIGGPSGAKAKEAEEILETAKQEAKELKLAAKVEGEESVLKLTDKAEQEIDKRRAEVKKTEAAIAKQKREAEKAKRNAEKLEGQLKKRQRIVESKEKQAEKLVAKAEEAQEAAKTQLEQIAGLSAEQAQEKLADAVRDQARAQVAEEIAEFEKKAAAEAEEKSKTIVATAIQRYASEFVQERTVSVVPLPSDDMKGRLIGREGRNIRALEAATGIDMIIDDTSGVITISCFNPVRREIARLAIAKLVSDGRIHPTRIEEVVRKAEREVDKQCKEAGEQATFDLGIHKMHAELITTIGRLKYRSTAAQNLLQHCKEVGYLAGLMADEVGANVKQAKRAGLLHDIGKALDHELEGTHAEVGAKYARKLGEHPAVCQAIKAHHGDVEPTSILDHLVDAANRLSSARPGARREQLAAYVSRLEDMEKICGEFAGVDKVFALQAGRELRIMVQNHKVTDNEARMLSKDIAKELERRASYAGDVKVVVVRETRASDYAR